MKSLMPLAENHEAWRDAYVVPSAKGAIHFSPGRQPWEPRRFEKKRQRRDSWAPQTHQRMSRAFSAESNCPAETRGWRPWLK